MWTILKDIRSPIALLGSDDERLQSWDQISNEYSVLSGDMKTHIILANF